MGIGCMSGRSRPTGKGRVGSPLAGGVRFGSDAGTDSDAGVRTGIRRQRTRDNAAPENDADWRASGRSFAGDGSRWTIRRGRRVRRAHRQTPSTDESFGEDHLVVPGLAIVPNSRLQPQTAPSMERPLTGKVRNTRGFHKQKPDPLPAQGRSGAAQARPPPSSATSQSASSRPSSQGAAISGSISVGKRSTAAISALAAARSSRRRGG